MAIFRDAPVSCLQQELQRISPEAHHWKLAILNTAAAPMELVDYLYSQMGSRQLMEISQQQDTHIFIWKTDPEVVFLFKGSLTHHLSRPETLVPRLFVHHSQAGLKLTDAFHILDLGQEMDEALSIAAQKFPRAEAPVAEPVVPATYHWDEELYRQAVQLRKLRARPLVLLAEDNQFMRHLAKSTLMHSYDVLCADDGVDAIQVYNRHAPDLLLLDMAMPRLDGWQVMRAVTAADDASRIVIFTGSRGEEVVAKALAAGAKGYVTKPFTGASLLHHTARAITAPK